MFRNLVGIIFRPNKTLDRLIDERKFGQSWGVTWFLVGFNLLVVFLIGIFFARELNELSQLFPMEDGLDGEVGLWAILPFFLFSLIGIPLYYVLSRFFFAWMVQLGVRISAAGKYSRDPEDSRERAALLRLVQPYTLWIVTLASLVPALFLPFVMDFSDLIEMGQMIEMSDEPPAEMITWIISLMLWSVISNLLQLGLFIHMIVVRTFAIKKIYGISGSQAFWGPFLIYFLLYFGLFLLFFVVALVNVILTGGTSGPPML